MKPYVVELTIRAVVVAEDEVHAYCVAESAFRDMARDEDPEIWVEREVHSKSDLPSGWDLQCIPYGGDGSTYLAAFIADLAAKTASHDTTKGPRNE